MSYVIVVGHPFEGMTMFGPFDTLEEAQNFHEECGLADGYWDYEFNDIVPVHRPDEWDTHHG